MAALDRENRGLKNIASDAFLDRTAEKVRSEGRVMFKPRGATKIEAVRTWARQHDFSLIEYTKGALAGTVVVTLKVRAAEVAAVKDHNAVLAEAA